jgi:hypothetical protein
LLASDMAAPFSDLWLLMIPDEQCFRWSEAGLRRFGPFI